MSRCSARDGDATPVQGSEDTAVRFAKARSCKGIAEIEVAEIEAHEVLTALLSDPGCFWGVARTASGLESRAVMFGETVAVAIGGADVFEAAWLLLSALEEREGQ